jgi:two-component system response regulator HydG
MPQTLQVKLLRALQEHEVTPVGSSATQKFDARIIAATNRNLEFEVAEGRFREDLFYRLNVIEIVMPPLRERREDIPLLVKHFIAKASQTQHSQSKTVTKDAMKAIGSYDWPGNVRELENAVERAIILAGDEIRLDDLPPKVRSNTAGYETNDTNGFRQTLDDMEKRYILEILKAVDEDKTKAANILGIDLSTLYRKLKRYEEY